MNRYLIKLSIFLSIIALIYACGGDPKKKSMHRNNQMFNEVSSDQKCIDIKNPEPFVIRWDAAQRSQLEANLKKGLIFVSYSGCQLKVIKSCRLSSQRKYQYETLNPKKEEYKIKDVNELYLKLPFNAAELEADLKNNEQFILSTIFAGYYEDTNQDKYRKMDLTGDDCDQVTHVISRMYIGAFELNAGKDNTKSVNGRVLDRKAGFKSGTEEGLLASDGVMADCFKGEGMQARCSAMIKIEMTNIDQSMKNENFRTQICPTNMAFDQEKQECISVQEAKLALAQKQGNTKLAQRFVIQGDVAFDTQTGLSWQRESSPHLMDWKTAKKYCADLTLSSKPWRLAKINELMSLVDLSQPGAKIDSSVFPNTPAKIYWSFTPDASTPGEAKVVDFHLGKTESLGIATKKYVRCVTSE
jgi:hypothetical protein